MIVVIIVNYIIMDEIHGDTFNPLFGKNACGRKHPTGEE